MDDVLARITALEAAHRRTERSLRCWRGTALGLLFLLVGGILVGDGPAMAAPGAGTSSFLLNDLNRLLRRISDVEAVVARHDLVVRLFTPGAPRRGVAADAGDTETLTGDVTLTGNLYIVNGAGSTATTNASGNLIVGYNETGNIRGDTRTGTRHNIA